MNLNPTNLDKMLSSRTFQEDVIAISRGWKVQNHFVMDLAIVIAVKTGVSFNTDYSASIPQFSINARVLGKNDSFSENPQLDIPSWFTPLFPNNIVCVPEVGELVTILREGTSNDSKGYWIGRVNDSDFVSLKLAKEHLGNLSPQEKYGMPFDVKNLNETSRQPQANDTRKVYQLPAKLGDVIMQGRNGSFLRHSYNPSYGAFNKPGVLEMGILHDRHYRTTGFPAVGVTKTKTIHLAESKASNLGKRVLKRSYLDNDFEVLPDGALIDTPTGPRPAGDFPEEVRKNIIASFADEFYSISTSEDSEELMHKQVLGEKLNDSLTEQDELIMSLVDSVSALSNTVELLFNSYLDHTHTLPEINIDLPEKEIEFKTLVNKGVKLVPQPSKRVFVPASRVRVPGSGDVYETVKEINRSNGKEVEIKKLVAKGTPGSTITIPSKFITVPQAPKVVNKGYRTVTKRKKIDFEAITIGGQSNPRITTTIETDDKTTLILNNLNDLEDSFTDAKSKFIDLIDKLEEHLSKRNYIN